ncbi:MAG: glycosyltransferase [Halomonadaceae bacterium]|nr:MAG: glycosyltransferase [Halomonadaceae bacterium]
MEGFHPEHFAIYLFSYNRGKFLDNCLESLVNCAEGHDVTIIDDGSDDDATRLVLRRWQKQFRQLGPDSKGQVEHKTGGLYNNMGRAMADARERQKTLVLLLQDDMQLVRPIDQKDLLRAEAFFAANPNAAQLQTCFMKRFFAARDEKLTILDSSEQAYLRPSDYPGFSGFSAVGLFHLDRFQSLFGQLRQGEYANNAFAQQHGIQMGIAAFPFMMWLPYPISHRGKQRNIPLQLVEGIAGCGFYPYRLMDQEAQERLHNRHPDQRPYAEEWLHCPPLQYRSVWSFAGGLSNLLARGGWRGVLGRLLGGIKKRFASS